MFRLLEYYNLLMHSLIFVCAKHLLPLSYHLESLYLLTTEILNEKNEMTFWSRCLLPGIAPLTNNFIVFKLNL